jgi:hypothetical protein
MLKTCVRHFSKPKLQQKKNLQLMLAPHAAIAGLMFMTSNAHLMSIPLTTATIHYLYKYNHIKKFTLYYDM